MPFHESLTAARAGDRDAANELFERWRPLLRLLAARLLGPELSARIDPSDVVQETFAQAYSELHRFDGDQQGQWVAWLQRLVMGHAAKTRRFHYAAKRNPNCETPITQTPTKNSEESPESAIIELEEAAVLAEAIDRLPEAMREAVVHRVFLQQPWDEVAAALGKSPGAARVLWTRALERLRENTDDS